MSLSQIAGAVVTNWGMTDIGQNSEDSNSFSATARRLWFLAAQCLASLSSIPSFTLVNRCDGHHGQGWVPRSWAPIPLLWTPSVVRILLFFMSPAGGAKRWRRDWTKGVWLTPRRTCSSQRTAGVFVKPVSELCSGPCFFVPVAAAAAAATAATGTATARWQQAGGGGAAAARRGAPATNGRHAPKAEHRTVGEQGGASSGSTRGGGHHGRRASWWRPVGTATATPCTYFNTSISRCLRSGLNLPRVAKRPYRAGTSSWQRARVEGGLPSQQPHSELFTGVWCPARRDRTAPRAGSCRT